MPTSLAGQRVTVMGLGRFGGGLGVTRFLADQGASIVLTDRLPEGELTNQLEPLRPLIDSGQVVLRLGGHDPRDFQDADLVIANPAVPTPWRDPFLCVAAGAGVRITTEIGLCVERLPIGVPLAAITGSAGKSTTAALTAHILGRALGSARAVWLGGNIGGSLLGQLPHMTSRDAVVLELSSAMLWWLAGAPGLSDAAPAPLRPSVGVVTSFAPNHLDWHESAEHYARAKQSLLRTLEPGGLAILGPGALDWPTPAGVERAPVSDAPGVAAPSAMPLPPLLIPGPHNARNARMALAAGARVAPEASWGDLSAAASSFAGLSHRLCLVHEAPGGIRFYDDSKSTVPEATLLALDALAPASIHLIAGGYDKGLDLSPIARRAGALAGLYTLGATGESLARSGREVGGAGAHVEGCGTLGRAMGSIRDRALPGDVVLLSPGCASWDQFENFEHRGREFARLARDLWASPAPGAAPAAR